MPISTVSRLRLSFACPAAPYCAALFAGTKFAQLTSDGRFLYLVRELDRASHEFCVEVLEPFLAPTSAAGSSDRDRAGDRRERDREREQWLARAVRRVVLPPGWTQFPRARLSDPSAAARALRHHFYPGKRIDARDSVNAWCAATVVQVAASRVLIHYENWASKWDGGLRSAAALACLSGGSRCADSRCRMD
jgi:hypothetical protein